MEFSFSFQSCLDESESHWIFSYFWLVSWGLTWSMRQTLASRQFTMVVYLSCWMDACTLDGHWMPWMPWLQGWVARWSMGHSLRQGYNATVLAYGQTGRLVGWHLNNQYGRTAIIRIILMDKIWLLEPVDTGTILPFVHKYIALLITGVL